MAPKQLAPNSGGVGAVGPELNVPLGAGVGGVGVEEAGVGLEKCNTTSLELLHLPNQVKGEVRYAWQQLGASHQTPETIGRTVYAAFFERCPEAKSLFHNGSKSGVAIKFMKAVTKLLSLLDDPEDLKDYVLSLSFRHMAYFVHLHMIAALRGALLHVLYSMVPDLTMEASDGMALLMNYVGGGILYARSTFWSRVQTLKASWVVAQAGTSLAHRNAATTKSPSEDGSGNSGEQQSSPRGSVPNSARTGSSSPSRLRRLLGRSKTDRSSAGGDSIAEGSSDNLDMPTSAAAQVTAVIPTSFEEMFSINASVMGVKKNSVAWMQEVLESFDGIVMNINDWDRLREECEVLAVRISKYPEGTVNLKQFRGCLLASLRSLLPKDWSSDHEDAWTWLWDTIAKSLAEDVDKPFKYEMAYKRCLENLEEHAKYKIRSDIYTKFFESCPEGHDFFKQSNTRLHFIADMILQMCLEIYQSPKQTVSNLSALGLRHVGFGVTTDLVAPFRDATIATMKETVADRGVTQSFAWALRLLAKVLVRTIREGSTVVMKSINSNSVPALKKAISAAPRSMRATWVLDIQVGDQHISPLAWAIESGSVKVAEAILDDLLTIRADRDRYYYGADELWTRHPDIVKKLQDEAPGLLVVLLEGLIWRSHRTSLGMRRVNYYVKHVLVKADGTFADALECVSGTGDPSLVSHPTVALLADCLWTGVVVRQFISSRMWNVFSLFIFIMSQEVLPTMNSPEEPAYDWLIFFGRMFTYTVGMGRLAAYHLYRIWVWCRNTMRRIIKEIDTDGNGEIDYEEMVEALQKFKETVQEEFKKAIKALREDGPGVDEAKKSIANREKNMYTVISFSLLLLLGVMLSHEPMFWCSHAENWPTEYCGITGSVGDPMPLKYRYSIFAMCAMAVHWLILIDLAVFSTEISAFLLVCGHVLAEVKQFLSALAFLLLAFGSTISILCTECGTEGGDFHDMPNAVISLFAITVGLYQGDFRQFSEDSLLLVCVTTFVSISVVLLLNLLVAQLNRSYEYIYTDMLGFARLNRASLLVDAMESCSKVRWQRFILSLELDKRLEFDEGDLGLAGGIASTEPAGKHLQTRESIRRYGGTTAPEAPWPEDALDRQQAKDDLTESDRLDELEELVNKIARKVNQLSLESTTGENPLSRNSSGDSKSGGDESKDG